MAYEGWLPSCIICKQFVKLEQSKTDEHGRAVHEDCYVSLLVQREHRSLARTEPKHERLSMTLSISTGSNKTAEISVSTDADIHRGQRFQIRLTPDRLAGQAGCTSSNS